MIRPTAAADAPALVQFARQTGAYRSGELQDLQDRLDAYPARADDGHRAVTYEHDGRPLGFAYYAPVAMTEGTWSLYWLIVPPAPPVADVGAALLRYAEQDIRQRHGRLLVIETSSRPGQESLRQLCAAQGYRPGAVLADFYADGEDQVIFRKWLAP